MIFAMNTFKMVFVLVVSIVFSFINKLELQTKQKLHKLPSDIIICTWGSSNELET